MHGAIWDCRHSNSLIVLDKDREAELGLADLKRSAEPLVPPHRNHPVVALQRCAPVCCQWLGRMRVARDVGASSTYKVELVHVPQVGDTPRLGQTAAPWHAGTSTAQPRR